jgi:hypothetical protein
MVADRTQVSEGLYMTVEQYLALDESSDAKYEYLDGYVFMLRPPSSAYDSQAVDMAGGSVAHAALCARMASLLDQALIDGSCMVYTSDARYETSGAPIPLPRFDSGLRRTSGIDAEQSNHSHRSPFTNNREARSRGKIQSL